MKNSGSEQIDQNDTEYGEIVLREKVKQAGTDRECCRTERFGNTGAWLSKGVESGGQIGEEGIWHAHLHCVQKLGHHDAVVQIIGETTLGMLYSPPFSRKT